MIRPVEGQRDVQLEYKLALRRLLEKMLEKMLENRSLLAVTIRDDRGPSAEVRGSKLSGKRSNPEIRRGDNEKLPPTRAAIPINSRLPRSLEFRFTLTVFLV